VVTPRAAPLPQLKIENEDGKEKATGVKPVDVLNWRLSPRVIASSVDERLGGEGRRGVLEKAQDELGRKPTGEGQFHLPRSRAFRRRRKLENLNMYS